MPPYILHIGNKNYSSWSLRPWILLKQLGIEFTEKMYALYEPGTKAELLKVSPNGLVPALDTGEFIISESLAIAEYIAETYPELKVWPVNKRDRAQARAVCAEMAAGFRTVRAELPMNLKRSKPRPPLAAELQAKLDTEVARLLQIWHTALQTSGGPFLYGEFGAVDAFFAPVVFRFKIYQIELPSPQIEQYMQTMLGLPAMQEWEAAGKQETGVIDFAEVS